MTTSGYVDPVVRAARYAVVAAITMTSVSSCTSSDDGATPRSEQPAVSVTLERVPAISTTAPASASDSASGDVPGTAADADGGSSAPVLEGVVVPPGTFPQTEPLPPVAGSNLRLLGDAPALAYDVSPDGTWTAAIRSGELCVAPVADPLTAKCATPPEGLGPYTRGSWSPDGDAVVVMADPFGETASGVQIVRTDGSVVDVVPPGSEVEVPFDAVFLDRDRLLVVSLRRGVRATSLTIFDVAAGSSTQLGAYAGSGSSHLWLPYATPVAAGDRVLATIVPDGTGADGEFDLWQFPLDGSPPSLLVETAVRSRAPGSDDLLVPIAVRGDVMLAGFAGGRRDFEQEARNGAPMFALIPAAGGDPVLVPNGADRVHRVAELSPDGRRLGVISFYVGDDPAIREAALYMFSVASVASIVAGQPDWTELAGLSRAALAGDIGDVGSSIIWTVDDTVRLEMSDGVHALDLVPAR